MKSKKSVMGYGLWYADTTDWDGKAEICLSETERTVGQHFSEGSIYVSRYLLPDLTIEERWTGDGTPHSLPEGERRKETIGKVDCYHSGSYPARVWITGSYGRDASVDDEIGEDIMLDMAHEYAGKLVFSVAINGRESICFDNPIYFPIIEKAAKVAAGKEKTLCR